VLAQIRVWIVSFRELSTPGSGPTPKFKSRLEGHPLPMSTMFVSYPAHRTTDKQTERVTECSTHVAPPALADRVINTSVLLILICL